MGGSIPGLVVLGSIGKQPDQAMRSKPMSSTTPWPAPSGPALFTPVVTSFSDEQSCGSISQINPSLSNLLLHHGVSSQQ